MFDITKTKAVLWDLDDTLYSRVDAARRTFPGMFKEHIYKNRGDEFIEEAVSYMMTKVMRNSMIHPDIFNALLEKYPADKPFDWAKCIEYYYENIAKFAVPYDEQIEVIKKLKAMGIKTAIVTNIASDRLDSQYEKINTLGIAPLFDAIVYSGELGIHKPQREIFDYATNLLGVKNSECVFVGDDPDSDVEGALGAGMEIVWIDRWDYDGRFGDNPGVHRVKSVSEYFNI